MFVAVPAWLVLFLPHRRVCLGETTVWIQGIGREQYRSTALLGRRSTVSFRDRIHFLRKEPGQGRGWKRCYVRISHGQDTVDCTNITTLVRGCTARRREAGHTSPTASRVGQSQVGWATSPASIIIIPNENTPRQYLTAEASLGARLRN